YNQQLAVIFSSNIVADDNVTNFYRYAHPRPTLTICGVAFVAVRTAFRKTTFLESSSANGCISRCDDDACWPIDIAWTSSSLPMPGSKSLTVSRVQLLGPENHRVICAGSFPRRAASSRFVKPRVSTNFEKRETTAENTRFL